jgi:hypothetical protein
MPAGGGVCATRRGGNMNNSNRGGAVVRHSGTGGALVARADDVVARARALLSPRASAQLPIIEAPITCARTGTTFIGSGRRDGNKWVVSSSSLMRAKTHGGPVARAISAGFISAIEFPDGWKCPGCRRPPGPSGIWLCDCERFTGALHTCGDDGRESICACGKTEIFHFVEGGGGDLRGSSQVPRPTLAGSVALPRAAPAALPGRAPLLLPEKK